MKTLDAVTLMKKLRSISKQDKDWLNEHGDELSDLLYEESVGRAQSWAQGSMLGSPNTLKGGN